MIDDVDEEVRSFGKRVAAGVCGEVGILSICEIDKNSRRRD